MAEITVAYVKTKFSEHSGVKDNVIKLTNPEDPLAVAIDDAALGYAFDRALEDYESITGSKPDNDYKHDIRAMLEFTYAYLFMYMDDTKYYNIHHKIGNNAAQDAARRKQHTEPASKGASKQTYSKGNQLKGMMPKKGDPTHYDDGSN